MDFHFSLGYVARTCSPEVVNTERLQETMRQTIADYSFSPRVGPSFFIYVDIKNMEVWDQKIWMKAEISKDSGNEPFLSMINKILTAVLLCLQTDKVANHHDIFFTSLHTDLACRQQMPILPITVKQHEGYSEVRSWDEDGFVGMIANGTRMYCFVMQTDKEWIFVVDAPGSDSLDFSPAPDASSSHDSGSKRRKSSLLSIKVKNAIFHLGEFLP